ncbi:UDP-N-acetylmuramoyl-L-alanyl-D-glutamate--L-lysine ligase [Clostridioides difficile]|nr:UDP-N-acetylmuramoyl-L-alanyl-D-glutamate--L-lysine ligase [Clostridioides difficile]
MVEVEDFFFFKQKTAYEIMPSLVGSEMCIRDRFGSFPVKSPYVGRFNISNIMAAMIAVWSKGTNLNEIINCLLYTSDAADDMQCVEFRGRRTVKKKNLYRLCQFSNYLT